MSQPEKTLNELVRGQVLAEGPDIASEQDWANQAQFDQAREGYVDATLNAMTNAELLERISDIFATYYIVR